MPRLPLLRTPRPAFEKIHQHLNVSDIIHLSQCSKTAWNMLNYLETLKSDAGIEVTVSSGMLRVALETPRRGYYAWTPPTRLGEEGERAVERKIWGVVWKVRPGQHARHFLATITGDKELDLLHIVQYFKDLFSCPISYLHFEPDRLDFNKLFIESKLLHVANRIMVNEATSWTHDQVKFMLDNFITDDLDLTGSIPDDFEYQNLGKFPVISIDSAWWIGLEQVIRMSRECRQIKLGHSSFDIQELNQILKSWMESSNVPTTLECLKIIPIGFWPQGVENLILEGIETERGEWKRYNASRAFDESVRYQDGRDMTREDGTKATVVLTERFDFTVWSVEEPNVPRQMMVRTNWCAQLK